MAPQIAYLSLQILDLNPLSLSLQNIHQLVASVPRESVLFLTEDRKPNKHTEGEHTSSSQKSERTSSVQQPGESEDIGDQNNLSSGEEDGSCGEIEFHDVDAPAKEAKLKEKLLRKYGGYICTLKQEFMKRKKKGKLPKEARKKLLDWWYQHYKWPYPSEGEKAVLAESTGLDHKQINNWFINQRKRHWKPSDDMHYAMVGSPSTSTHHHYHHNTAINPFADTTSLRTQTGVLPTDRF